MRLAQTTAIQASSYTSQVSVADYRSVHYEAPESFDFNGDWVAHAGHHYDIDMRFTIRNNVLVSLSCGTSEPLTFAFPRGFVMANSYFSRDDSVAISGRLVSPVNSVGTINVPACPEAQWWADKSGVAAVSRYAYTGR